MQETGVQSLGQEDLLEQEMATHSNILAWEIPWTEEPGGPQSMGVTRETRLTKQIKICLTAASRVKGGAAHNSGRWKTADAPVTEEKRASGTALHWC